MREDPEVPHAALEPTPTAVNYRRFGIIMLLFYLFFPTLMFQMQISPHISGPGINLIGVSETYQLLFYLIAAFALVLAYARKRDRDWKALDKGFGILLLVAAAMMAWTGMQIRDLMADAFLPGTWRLVQCTFIAFPLLYCLAAWCLIRHHCAATGLYLALLVAMIGWLNLHPIEGDSPKYMELRHSSEFFLSVGTGFEERYSRTRSPEEIKATFGMLDERSLAALEAWIGPDAVEDLLESGDDAAFSARFYPDFDAHRDEGGRVELTPIESATPETDAVPFLFNIEFATTKLLFVSIFGYTIWRAYRQRYEKRHADVV